MRFAVGEEQLLGYRGRQQFAIHLFEGGDLVAGYFPFFQVAKYTWSPVGRQAEKRSTFLPRHSGRFLESLRTAPSAGVFDLRWESSLRVVTNSLF